MLSILMILFPRLRTKLVWAQGLRYKELIRATTRGAEQMARDFPSANDYVKGSLKYTHNMAGSCRDTRFIVLVKVLPKGKQ